jgi:hypothetical protein
MMILLIVLAGLAIMNFAQHLVIVGLRTELQDAGFRRTDLLRKEWENVYSELSDKYVEKDNALVDAQKMITAQDKHLTNTINRCSELLLENRELKRERLRAGVQPSKWLSWAEDLRKEVEKTSEEKRNEGPATIPGGAGCYGTIKGCHCLACIFGSGAV